MKNIIKKIINGENISVGTDALIEAGISFIQNGMNSPFFSRKITTFLGNYSFSEKDVFQLENLLTSLRDRTTKKVNFYTGYACLSDELILAEKSLSEDSSVLCMLKEEQGNNDKIVIVPVYGDNGIVYALFRGKKTKAESESQLAEYYEGIKNIQEETNE
jgi:hypothetical protein